MKAALRFLHQHPVNAVMQEETLVHPRRDWNLPQKLVTNDDAD